MSSAPLAFVDRIFVHPVKGLSPEERERVPLVTSHGIPGDRGFALVHEEALPRLEPRPGEEPASVAARAFALARDLPWTTKKLTVMQHDWPELAAFACSFDESARRLRVSRGGELLLDESVDKETSRAAIDRFFTEQISKMSPSRPALHPLRAGIRLVGNGGRASRYQDRESGHVSLLNERSLLELEQDLGVSLDVRRFRGNFILRGLAAWEETDLVGREVRLGGVRLYIKAPIGRCFNINVDPEEGTTEVEALAALAKTPGKGKFGVVGQVLSDGEVAVGDRLEPLH